MTTMNEFDVNKGGVAKLIRKNKAFMMEMKNTFPDIAPEIVSLSINPNCSCRRKIYSFIDKNEEGIMKFLWDYHKNHTEERVKRKALKRRVREMDFNHNERLQQMEQKTKEIKEYSETKNQEREKRSIRGEVVEMEPDPMAYKRMLVNIDNNDMSFSGLSVMETEKEDENGDTKTVWLVFFY